MEGHGFGRPSALGHESTSPIVDARAAFIERSLRAPIFTAAKRPTAALATTTVIAIQRTLLISIPQYSKNHAGAFSSSNATDFQRFFSEFLGPTMSESLTLTAILLRRF